MQPPRSAVDDQGDLFRSRLDQLLDAAHPLYKLADATDWKVFEREFEPLYHAETGRPGLPIRLLVGLHYLKYLHDVSDEIVVATWLENPYWQYFCGGTYFQHRFPCNPTTLVKWRQRVGADGLEKLLQETLAIAQRSGLLPAQELKQVNVDTTVQEKAVAFPTDARLYNKARRAVVRVAKTQGLPLRQSYERLGPRALQQQGRYSAARQGRRAKRETKRLRTYLGRVLRDVRRQCVRLEEQGKVIPATLKEQLERAQRIYAQERKDRNKLYSMHAPEVECIAKGKVHQKYEFGCKVQIVTTSRQGWVVGIDAAHAEVRSEVGDHDKAEGGTHTGSGTPYDGATLKPALDQMERLTGSKPKTACVDRGFRGSKYHPEEVEVLVSGRRGLSAPLKKLLKRRAAIEPVIGHIKAEHGLDRNYLKGREGDRINAMLSGCGFNLRKLLRASHKLKALWRLLSRWLQAMSKTPIWQTRPHANG
jgi:IS5 family transposase